MKIVAFAGSISSDSINKKLVEWASSQFDGAEVEVLDLNDYEMPIFSSDREKEIGVHPLAQKFAEKIDGADLLLISLAEYNSSYTAAFKNTFDWVSRIKDRKHFGEKPVFLLSTALGPGGGKNVSEMFMKRAPFSGANVLTNFVLPKFKESFEAEKGIIDGEKKAEFAKKLQTVKDYFSAK